MSILVMTRKPESLLKSIYKKIDEQVIRTWRYDKDRDLTHTTSGGQWEDRAWLHPETSEGLLRFGLVGQDGIAMTPVLYGVYHGRFIEMLLTHFDHNFSSVCVSAIGDENDNFVGIQYKKGLLNLG